MKGHQSLKIKYVGELKHVSDFEASIMAYAIEKHVKDFFNDPKNVKAFETGQKTNRTSEDKYGREY